MMPTRGCLVLYYIVLLTANRASVLCRVNYCYAIELCKTLDWVVARAIRATTKELVKWEAFTVFLALSVVVWLILIYATYIVR